MAKYFGFYGAGESDSNEFNTDFLSNLLYYAPDGAQLSDDKSAMVFDFGTGGVAMVADAKFDGAWNGTINTVVYVEDGYTLAAATELLVDGAAMRDALANGDVDTINELAWSGDDTIYGGASMDTLRGYAGKDIIYGLDGHDTLIGDAGNDKLFGGSGDDNISGGAGADGLSGGAGEDVLIGGAGNDSLIGGAGADTLSGGTGADRFIFRSIGQLRGNGFDWITDFSHAEGDKIDVSGIDANIGVEGNQAFTFIDNVADTLTAPPAAGSLLVEDGGARNTYAVTLFVDDSGHGQTFLVVSVGGVLTADDFIL